MRTYHFVNGAEETAGTMRLLWWGLIALSVVVIARVWWFWSGPCWGTASDMSCQLAPNATWPVAIGVTAVASMAIAASCVALRRAHKGRTPTNLAA